MYAWTRSSHLSAPDPELVQPLRIRACKQNDEPCGNRREPHARTTKNKTMK